MVDGLPEPVLSFPPAALADALWNVVTLVVATNRKEGVVLCGQKSCGHDPEV